jgi:hypothetical protein
MTAAHKDNGNSAATRPEKPRELERSPHVQNWDQVDEASWESFPASDPPGKWAGRDQAPPTLNGEVEADEPDDKEPQS